MVDRDVDGSHEERCEPGKDILRTVLKHDAHAIASFEPERLETISELEGLVKELFVCPSGPKRWKGKSNRVRALVCLPKEKVADASLRQRRKVRSRGCAGFRLHVTLITLPQLYRQDPALKAAIWWLVTLA